MTDLNNPHTRQQMLRERLDSGAPLVATVLASELDVSIDTLRRDLIELEQQGVLRRVRGGAVPATNRMPSYFERAFASGPEVAQVAARAVQLIPQDGTIFIDGGTTTTAIAAAIPVDFRGLIVTPAPSVALAAMHREAKVHLIGGMLRAEGAIATGGDAEHMASRFAADLCFLGACALWPEFGLCAEDALEAGVKRAMALASSKVVVATTGGKLQRRGRFKILELTEIDALVTDAAPADIALFQAEGIEVFFV